MTVLVRLPLAEPLPGEASLEPLELIFDEEIPPFNHQRDHADCLRWYRRAAEKCVSAMESHAPGGFMDALLAVLCERRASILRVRAAWPPEPET